MKLLYLIANHKINPSAAAFVGKVAAKMGASLTILAAAEDETKLEKIRSQVQVLGSLPGTAPERTHFVKDDPVAAMEAELARQDYTLILVNVSRRRRVIPSNYRFLSQRIIKHANVPVMLVRNISKNFERMLVCTGGLEISEPVVHLSTKLAGTTGLLATLLTVSVAVPSMYTGMEVMDETLEELLETETPMAQHLRHSAEELAGHGIQAEIKISHGDVVEAILEETKEGHYDLVVLGETEGTTLRGLLLGNVTQQIINRAPCAVLISKPHAEPSFE